MQDKFRTLLPDTIEGWTSLEKDRLFNPDNLYEYINGGAELFLSYGFHKMVTRIYHAPDQPDIIVDIFDMGNSYNAYGLFSYSRETENDKFGQGSQYVSGLLLFWKDKYYVSILFHPETPEAKKTVFNIARYIESNILRKGPLPKVLNLLPEDGLQKESVRYFRHHIWMNTYTFISNENILNITDSTNAVMAKYGQNNKQKIVLLIQYKNDLLAESAFISFSEFYSQDFSTDTITKKDDSWIGCQKYKEYIILVFQRQNKQDIENIFTHIKKNIHNSF
ncbi:MAG: hypothetical protein JXR46_11650 [Calditrichaceae bacterium]|nr:hypothetical protein [Calditrichaceae bacterium]MBN2709689.1 hypothetical protein [Calditrichaceae bacterium]